jgi:hypothetical protein
MAFDIECIRVAGGAAMRIWGVDNPAQLIGLLIHRPIGPLARCAQRLSPTESAKLSVDAVAADWHYDGCCLTNWHVARARATGADAASNRHQRAD